MKDFLAAREVLVLKEAHHASRFRKSADRIKTILLLNEGFSSEQIAKILMLDEVTIRRYLVKYQASGVDGLLEYHYQGASGLLTKFQEQELTNHLREQTYQTVSMIVAFIRKTYGKRYSIDGATHMLHRLGFVYKKTRQVPGKFDQEKQDQFKKEYRTLKITKGANDKIYFVDAAHPHHNNRPYYGWIFRGDVKTVKANTGRERINLNGALNIEDMDITVLSEPTINYQAMERLMLSLEVKQPEGQIHLIADNARYNHNHKLKEFLVKHERIHLHFLPPYSPNLNIIERLWKFFRRKHDGCYFEKFVDFKEAVLTFFADINQYENELKTLLTDNFQTLPA